VGKRKPHWNFQSSLVNNSLRNRLSLSQEKMGFELIHKEGNVTNHYHVQNLHWQLSIDGKVEKSEYDKFVYVLIATLWTFVVVLTTLLLTSHVDVL